jgi:hypothetical protein
MLTDHEVILAESVLSTQTLLAKPLAGIATHVRLGEVRTKEKCPDGQSWCGSRPRSS